MNLALEIRDKTNEIEQAYVLAKSEEILFGIFNLFGLLLLEGFFTCYYCLAALVKENLVQIKDVNFSLKFALGWI